MERIVNTQQAEAWNGYEGQYWADHSERWDEVVGGLNEPLFDTATIGRRDRVLDVGCGNGQTTRLAGGLAAQGHALGVDLSEPMVKRARIVALRPNAGRNGSPSSPRPCSAGHPGPTPPTRTPPACSH